MSHSERIGEMYKHIAQMQNSLVQYPSVNELLLKFREAIHYRECTGIPKNYMLYGRPGVGKTTLRKCIEHEFPQVIQEDRVLRPVLSVIIPSRPTIKNVAEEILVSLGDPCFSRGSSADKTNRIINAVKDLDIKMFLFDEVQHFVEGGNKNTPREAADWLKVLIDTSRASTILLGTEPVKKILEVNDQLRRRFSAVLELKPFSISSSECAKEFAAIIRHIDRKLGLPNPVDYSDSNLIGSLHYATNGIMDYIVKLLIQAYQLALENGKTQITRVLLEEAFTESIWVDGVGTKNPFNPKFIQKYLDYESGMPFRQ